MQQHSTALMIFFIIILVFNKFFYKKKNYYTAKTIFASKSYLCGTVITMVLYRKKLHTVYLKLYKPPL